MKDTQCGLKVFKTKALFKEQKINGFGFDAELFYLAKRHNMLIKEVPVIWINHKGSKVNLIKDSYKMFKDLLRTKRLHKN
jgi:dolichyl-phosphate beta-glucosyltransferase